MTNEEGRCIQDLLLRTCQWLQRVTAGDSGWYVVSEPLDMHC